MTISYPDTVDLGSFVDYVSQRLGIKIIYSDEVRNQTVVFRPGEVEVPTDQLLDLLRSMLRMRDLALVEGDVKGWLRIIASSDMQRHVSEIRREALAPEDAASNQVVTQAIQLASDDMDRIVNLARDFLSSPKASVIQIPDKKLIIITDYASAIAKAMQIIKLLDTPRLAVEVVTVPVIQQDAVKLAERVVKVLSDKAKLEGTAERTVTVQGNAENGSILLVGTKKEIAEVRELISRFDVASADRMETVPYAPEHITAGRLQLLIQSVVAPDASKHNQIRLFLDEATNRLYVTAPPDVHKKVTALLAKEDVASLEPSRPLRVYTPRNRLARDLIGTLSEVLPNVSATTTSETGGTAPDTTPRVPPGPNRPPAPPGAGQAPPVPPAQEAIVPKAKVKSQVTRVKGPDFVLSYDDHTNSIIAIGPREFHEKLAQLITLLDKRQPQVLIEMTLVAMTFNDSLSLAVELANEEKPGNRQSLFFSAFGISDIDLATGARALNPGGGLNGIIMGPNETPIVMRAIAAHGDSRVVTTPKIIVSDNTTATLSSVSEEPFTSVNASNTVATTSFAGFESAGTTLTVTPHIAQGDHLTLDYSFNFSNFTGGSEVGVPPPRATNTFSGAVEIPDGYSIVIGGLVTENEADSATEVPLLGRLPIIGPLFQSSDRARTKSRIYAFIRATVLRDDTFEDLRIISEGELRRAELANHGFPPSEYAWMR